MAKTSWPFDTQQVSELQWRRMGAIWRPTGVLRSANDVGLSSGDNGLQPFGDSSGMQVKVRAGAAWVEGAYFRSDAEETIAISAAHGSLARKDLLVVRVDWANNNIDLAVKAGTPAASPVLPVVQQDASLWEIAIAEITIPAAATLIGAGDVADVRDFSDVIVVGGVQSPYMTNKSGSTVDLGDVVVIDSDNDSAFTLTTAAADLRVFGVAAQTIINNAAGLINAIHGTLATVNCDTGAVGRGEWLVSSATTKKAKGGGYSRPSGGFAIALTSKAAGSNGTVSAMLLPEPPLALAGTSSWVMAGFDTANSTNTQKFVHSTGVFSTVAGAAAVLAKRQTGGMGYTNISAIIAGGFDSTYSQNTQKLTFATETMATIAGLALPAQRSRLGAGQPVNGTKGYAYNGVDNTNTASTSVYRATFATDTMATASGGIAAHADNIGTSDGLIGYVVGGTSTAAEKITFATDVSTDLNSGDSSFALGLESGFSIPASAGYYGNDTGVGKIIFSTGTWQALGSAYVGLHGDAAGLTNGVSLAWIAGDDGGTRDNTDAFTRATETFAAAPSSVMALGKFRCGAANNGAYN